MGASDRKRETEEGEKIGEGDWLSSEAGKREGKEKKQQINCDKDVA